MWKLGVVLVVFFLVGHAACRGPIIVCITNCVQCKQMFGRFFEGKICADACILTDGTVTPDCNNPGSVGKYLKRFF